MFFLALKNRSIYIISPIMLGFFHDISYGYFIPIRSCSNCFYLAECRNINTREYFLDAKTYLTLIIQLCKNQQLLAFLYLSQDQVSKSQHFWTFYWFIVSLFVWWMLHYQPVKMPQIYFSLPLSSGFQLLIFCIAALYLKGMWLITVARKFNLLVLWFSSYSTFLSF